MKLGFVKKKKWTGAGQSGRLSKQEKRGEEKEKKGLGKGEWGRGAF